MLVNLSEVMCGGEWLSLISWTEPRSVLGGSVPFDVCSAFLLLRASPAVCTVQHE